MTKYRTISQAKKAEPERFRLKKGPNGNNLCRFCGTEVVPPRRTFCSGEMTRYSYPKVNGKRTKSVYHQGWGCVHEFLIRSRPQYARNAVFDRDQGTCAMCGMQHARKGTWHADHIIPVWNGGGECGLDNLQTLCNVCHKIKTAQEAGVRKKCRHN